MSKDHFDLKGTLGTVHVSVGPRREGEMTSVCLLFVSAIVQDPFHAQCTTMVC